jgi:hypothetical protein
VVFARWCACMRWKYQVLARLSGTVVRLTAQT